VTTVLVIEDERDLAAGICANLELEGYTAIVAHSGEAALNLAREHSPDLVVLDLMLPGMSGFEVLRALRATAASMPILILSARVEEVDKVRGFRAGADDYVTKPFGVLELMLRLRALLRRAGQVPLDAGADERTAVIGTARVDLERRVVSKNGVEIPLTPRATELLAALLRRRDRVVTRHELLRDVWGYAPGVTTRTVDAHIAELRRRIEDNPSTPAHLVTVWKAGYRLRG